MARRRGKVVETHVAEVKGVQGSYGIFIDRVVSWGSWFVLCWGSLCIWFGEDLCIMGLHTSWLLNLTGDAALHFVLHIKVRIVAAVKIGGVRTHTRTPYRDIVSHLEISPLPLPEHIVKRF
jgi:hypothetical protein